MSTLQHRHLSLPSESSLIPVIMHNPFSEARGCPVRVRKSIALKKNNHNNHTTHLRIWEEGKKGDLQIVSTGERIDRTASINRTRK